MTQEQKVLILKLWAQGLSIREIESFVLLPPNEIESVIYISVNEDS